MENYRGDSPPGKKGTSPSRLREFFSDWRYLKVSFYVAFTAALLYILYFTIKNIDTVAVTVGGVLGSVLSALSPLIIGLILAYLISPLVELVDRQLISRIWSKLPSNAAKREKRIQFRRTMSIILTFVMIIFAAFLIIYAFAFLIVGRLFFDSVSGMLESIAFYFSQYEAAFREFMTKLPDSGLEEQVENLFNDVALWVSDHFSASGVIRALTGIGISLMNTVLGIVVAIYLIKDKDFFQGLWRNFIDSVTSRKLAQSVGATLNDVDEVFSRFLRGQLLDALIVAILASIVLTIIGLDFAVLLGCFAGLTNVIPYFGAVFGAIPAVLVALLTGGVTQALITIAAFVAIQQIDANIIYPRVVGSSTGLHPVFVLLSVTFAGYFWGIVGMVLAVPVAGCIKLILVRNAAARQAKSVGSIRQ